MHALRCPRPASALASVLALACLLGQAPAMAASLGVQVLSSAGQALEHAAVFLESREARSASKPMKAVEVQQIDKRFDPLVSIVTTGTELHFPNRDKVRHHVYSFSAPKAFELKLYTGTPSKPVLFDKPGIVVLGCNIHDRMMAWVVVVDTPHFARTGADGHASLRDVPPGSYRLRVWHPELPPGSPATDSAIVVPAGAMSTTVRLAGKSA